MKISHPYPGVNDMQMFSKGKRDINDYDRLKNNLTASPS